MMKTAIQNPNLNTLFLAKCYLEQKHHTKNIKCKKYGGVTYFVRKKLLYGSVQGKTLHAYKKPADAFEHTESQTIPLDAIKVAPAWWCWRCKTYYKMAAHLYRCKCMARFVMRKRFYFDEPLEEMPEELVEVQAAEIDCQEAAIISGQWCKNCRIQVSLPKGHGRCPRCKRYLRLRRTIHRQANLPAIPQPDPAPKPKPRLFVGVRNKQGDYFVMVRELRLPTLIERADLKLGNKFVPEHLKIPAILLRC